MKELSIKEKAKAYDKASKWMEGIYPTLTHEQQMEAEAFFPMLNESEDEKILRHLKAVVKAYDMWTERGLSMNDVLTWIEKQGEHAHFLSKIQVGDMITRNEDGVLVILSQLNRVAKKDEKQGEKPQGKSALEAINEEKVDNAKKLTEFEKAIKQVIEEAIECGDTRNLKGDAEMLLSLVHNSAWSEEDKAMLTLVMAVLSSNKDDEYFAMSDTTVEDCFNWLKALKDRVQPQPKQYWSEEDKKIIDRIESEFLALHRGDYKNIDFNDVDKLTVLNWVRKIKSIRFQNTWKPSGEQMKALSNINVTGCISYAGQGQELINLYNDLKKLREE